MNLFMNILMNRFKMCVICLIKGPICFCIKYIGMIYNQYVFTMDTYTVHLLQPLKETNATSYHLNEQPPCGQKARIVFHLTVISQENQNIAICRILAMITSGKYVMQYLREACVCPRRCCFKHKTCRD